MEKQAPTPYRKDHRNELDTQTVIILIIVSAFCLLLFCLLLAVVVTIWNHRGYFGIVIGQMGPGQYRPTVINLLFPLIESVAVFVGFGATILQLRRNHLDKLVEDKWQRAQFVADEIRRFNSDQAVRNIKSILESIGLETPAIIKMESTQEEIDSHPTQSESHPGGLAKVVRVVEFELKPQQLINAFTPDSDLYFVNIDTGLPNLDTPITWTPVDFKIWRDLDEFMNYTINFSKLYRQGILLGEDLHPYLYYWFNIMVPNVAPGNDPESRSGRILRQLQRFLKAYYDGPGPDRRDEGQCAFMCALLDSQGLEHRSRETAEIKPGRYEINFAHIDISPSGTGI